MQLNVIEGKAVLFKFGRACCLAFFLPVGVPAGRGGGGGNINFDSGLILMKGSNMNLGNIISFLIPKKKLQNHPPGIERNGKEGIIILC